MTHLQYKVQQQITQIVRSYAEIIRFDIDKNKRVEAGKELHCSTLGLLELRRIYKSNPKHTGGASSLFGLQYLDVVSIHFLNSVDKFVSVIQMKRYFVIRQNKNEIYSLQFYPIKTDSNLVWGSKHYQYIAYT